MIAIGSNWYCLHLYSYYVYYVVITSVLIRSFLFSFPAFVNYIEFTISNKRWNGDYEIEIVWKILITTIPSCCIPCLIIPCLLVLVFSNTTLKQVYKQHKFPHFCRAHLLQMAPLLLFLLFSTSPFTWINTWALTYPLYTICMSLTHHKFWYRQSTRLNN